MTAVVDRGNDRSSLRYPGRVSSIGQLAFDEPRCDAAVELARLVGSRAELEQRLNTLDRQQRDAAAMLEKRSAELTALERRELEGEQVSAAQRGKAEEALTKAKVAHAANWAEKRSALRGALDGHQGRVQAFVAENFRELVAEVEQEGAEAARKVNDAATALVEAAHKRDAASRRLDALITAVRGQSKFGDVAISRSEAAVGAAERLLSDGGEVAPVLRDELRPREGVTADEPEPASV